LEEVYFWASIPSAEKIYEGLSTEFTDLEGLIRKMSSEKLTGYIDVTMGGGQEKGLIFLINGKIVGGSYSWDSGEPGPSKKNQGLLIHKTKEAGATFNVCRIPLSKLKTEGETRKTAKPSEEILRMLEELMIIFENSVASRKKMKADFTKLLKKKFVENADKYAFLDPFAGEFDYTNRTIDFSGAASDRELIDGVVNSIRELAQELGILQQLKGASVEWSDKYASQLDNFSIKL
jgi:hypothetical protein